MEDEITKHTKKAIESINNKEHSFAKKVKEVTIEIFIIVFAVSFSIWLHDWAEHRHEQKEVEEFLADLKEDLNNDIESMLSIKEQLSTTVQNYTFLTNLTETKFDSLIAVGDSVQFKGEIVKKISSSLVIRKNIDGNYEGFKSSGKIGFIENKKLKKSILEYYQQSIPSMTEADKYYNSNIIKMVDLLSELSGKRAREIIFIPKLKVTFLSTIMNGNNNINAYNEIIAQARNIIAEIDNK